MHIVFLVPPAKRTLCFAPRDLQRLEAAHDVVYAECETPDALRTFWDQHAASAETLVTGWDTPPLTAEQLDAAPSLRAIVHAAGSVRHLLPEGFWNRSIRLATARDALARGVAETTLGLIIAGLKGVFPADRLTSGGGWKVGDTQMPGWPVRELYDCSVGIIGASKVGRHMIRLLKPFEVEVLVADPHLVEAEAKELGVEHVELDELMRRCDVTSLHAPALPSTRRMLGAAQFRRMPDHAIFINTARGMIVDEDALVTELRTGRIWAFLDVTDPEPPAADHPLRTLPNCVLTPHIAGAISTGCRRLGRHTVDQLLELAAGKRMRDEMTADAFAVVA